MNIRPHHTLCLPPPDMNLAKMFPAIFLFGNHDNSCILAVIRSRPSVMKPIDELIQDSCKVCNDPSCGCVCVCVRGIIGSRCKNQ